MIRPEIAAIRQEYKLAQLHEKDILADPFLQFEKWWNEVLHSEAEEPNAMTLATSTREGKPSARIVLLKSFDQNGFIFFTNYESKKGRQLADNPFAALVFFWKELERQVRIEGTVVPTTSAESDQYFLSRPQGSRAGAWASPQSEVIAGRNILDAKMQEICDRFNDDVNERPPFWGGYRLQPQLVEFWQGRSNRLHDRIQFTLLSGNSWKAVRLAP